MNFFEKKVIKKIIFLGLLFVPAYFVNDAISLKTDYKGIPGIQKFHFPNSCLSTGHFSIYEDSSGIFLIGANNKVIIFYGNEFTTYPLTGTINITSNSRSVFFTGYNTLGLVRTYRNSPPQFIPIIDNKTNNEFDFGQISDLYVADQNLLFSNGKKLYEFDGSDFSKIDSSVQIQIFRVADSILIYDYKKGICVFKNGKLELIRNGEKIAKSTIEKILPFGSGLIVKTREANSFFLINSLSFKKLNFGFENFLDKAGFMDAVNIDNNNIAIGTKLEGLIIYNIKENIIRNITVKEGLLDNTVNNLHVDRNGDLWAFHDIGLSRIKLNVPVTTFGQYAGITGRVNDIIKYDHKLYLATSTGLLVSGLKNVENTDNFTQLFFTPVKSISSECLKLFLKNGKLYCIARQGIHEIINNSSRPVLNLDINCFRNVTSSDSVFYIGTENGILTLVLKKDKFISSGNKFDNVSITDICVDNDSNIWYRTASGSLVYFNPKKNKPIFTFFSALPGISQNINNLALLQTKEGTRIIFPGQIYYFNKIQSQFIVDTTLRLDRLKGISWLYPIVTDNFGNRWCHFMTTTENVRGILMIPSSGEPPSFFNTGSLISPVIVDGSQVWLGGYANLVQLNISGKLNSQNKFYTIIKRIIVGKDSILKLGLVEPDIAHSFNTVRFDVSFTNFESLPYVKFQYKLEGLEKQWSDWTSESYRQYAKLKAGKYVFKVCALNITGVVSDITEFSFYIQHPFYFTWPAFIIYFIVFCCIVLVFFRWRMWVFLKNKEKLEKVVQSRTLEIIKEKDKSEQLLANVFPKGMADELKSTGKATSQKFSMVTVLFSDIQGFTKIAEQMNPENLIDQLDTFFFHFDMVVEKYNIEKIKTIGDAYMCAGGIPKKNITNPVEVVLAALEVQEYMRELKSKNADIWDLRIGIHTGSVIAGVVGHKKLSYDIWGDTVNTASRMESSGEPGKINISGHTYELVREFFICEHRGKMPVKYKGEIDMYFVKGIRPELSVNMKNLPNKKFLLQVQLLRLQDIEEEIMEDLDKNLPLGMYFHNTKNIKDTYNIVQLLCRAEELNEEETLIVQTAALLHDVGFIWSYDDYENFSITHARELLPDFKYSGIQIEKVCALIELTKNNQKPGNILEEIILDASMHYLGRADYLTLSENLYKELFERGKIHSKEEWIRVQTNLLLSYKYYTKTAKMLCDANPDQQVQNILENSKISKI